MGKNQKIVIGIVAIFAAIMAIYFGFTSYSHNNNPDTITENQINKIAKSKPKGLNEAEKQVKDLSKVSAKTKVGKQRKQTKIDSVTDDALEDYFDKNVDNAKISNKNDIQRIHQNADSAISKFNKYSPKVTNTYRTKLKEWINEQNSSINHKKYNKKHKNGISKKQDPHNKSYVKFKNHPRKELSKFKDSNLKDEHTIGTHHSGNNSKENNSGPRYTNVYAYSNYVECYKYYLSHPGKVNKKLVLETIKDLKKRGYKFNDDMSDKGYESHNKKLADRDDKLMDEGKLG